jgi:prolyl 4-hydroxylase
MQANAIGRRIRFMAAPRLVLAGPASLQHGPRAQPARNGRGGDLQSPPMSKRDSQTSELREWILSTARAGHNIDEILRMLEQAGYGARQARQIVARTLDQPALALGVVAPKSGRRTRHPAAPWQQVGDRRIDVVLGVDAPPLRVLDNVLSAAECDALIELARPRLDRALTVDAAGKHQVDGARTSSGMFFKLGETELIRCLEQRLADLVGVPADHGEALQVLHYLPGQQYEPHVDWFDASQPGFAAITAKGGQRVASIIMYLNTPAGGGGTQFPRVGLTVTARRGAAVYFAYEGGDQISLHAGLPVTAGEKWIATKWVRERPYC